MKKKVVKLIAVYNDDKMVSAYGKVVKFTDENGIGNYEAKEYTSSKLPQEALVYVDRFINNCHCVGEPEPFKSFYEILDKPQNKYTCAVCKRKLTGREIGYCYRYGI